MWGGSAVWNRSGRAQLHLFFLLRFFNPVQQVLRFFQCPRHVVPKHRDGSVFLSDFPSLLCNFIRKGVKLWLK